jgi:hypothetical protein
MVRYEQRRFRAGETDQDAAASADDRTEIRRRRISPNTRACKAPFGIFDNSRCGGYATAEVKNQEAPRHDR